MRVDPSLEKDRELVHRLKRRDPDAMMGLYDRYGRLLYSIVLRAVNDRATAEDITQESFLRIWNRIVTFDEEKGNLEGWLVTVARNRAFDYLRSVRKAPETSAVSFTDFERSTYYFVDESRAERFAIAESVKSALNGLSRDQREGK